MSVILRPYQENEGIGGLRREFSRGVKRTALYSPTGCHARGELVLKADGTFVAAENVRVGDALIGDDGKPRTVIKLHSGRDVMARIIPVKGDSFTVNVHHVLSLVHTETGEICDVTVKEWLDWAKYRKHVHKLYRVGVENFCGVKSDLPISPWLLGVMLGDGSFGGTLIITNPEKNIQKKVLGLAISHGVGARVRFPKNRCERVSLTNRNCGGKPNALLEKIRELGLDNVKCEDKFIPHCYKVSDVKSRKEILAGLLDTDGHYEHGYDWISASKKLAHDIVFVARSLGFSAYMKECVKLCQTGASGTYWRVSISGDFSVLPTVKHQSEPRRQKKNVLRTGFSVELLPEDDYFGWEVDGNGRYLMSDFTVTHNSGKTEMAIEMIRLARLKGTRVVFLVNRVNLVEQASRRFYKSGIEHGVIQGKNTRSIDSGVLIASIQTVSRRGMPEAGLILIDEMHSCAGTKAYRDVIMQNPVVPVVGLSATPFSKGLGKDYPNLGPLFESIVVAATISDLIKMGYLLDVEIWAPTDFDLAGVKMVRDEFGGMDYNQRQLESAVDKPALVGDIVEHWKRLGGDKQTVCFATSIAHSKHIAECFNANGIRCEHIDAYSTDDERRRALANIGNGTTRIITCCSVLAEGWDEPKVECMIYARPTKSLIRWIQCSGRILRPYPGKTIARIIDHTGTAKRLGFPTDDLPLELDDGIPNKSAERGKKEEALPKECPKCHYLKPPKTHECPKCHFKPERQANVEVNDGELKKLERNKLKRMNTSDKEILYAELLGYARSKGYRDGYAWFAVKELCGSAPRFRMEAQPPGPETMKLIKHLNIRRAKRRVAESAIHA